MKELPFLLRMSSWLAWSRERSHISAPGIKSNIGVTFWREESWLSLYEHFAQDFRV